MRSSVLDAALRISAAACSAKQRTGVGQTKDTLKHLPEFKYAKG